MSSLANNMHQKVEEITRKYAIWTESLPRDRIACRSEDTVIETLGESGHVILEFILHWISEGRIFMNSDGKKIRPTGLKSCKRKVGNWKFQLSKIIKGVTTNNFRKNKNRRHLKMSMWAQT